MTLVTLSWILSGVGYMLSSIAIYISITTIRKSRRAKHARELVRQNLMTLAERRAER